MRDDHGPGARLPEGLSARGLAGKRDYVRSLEQRKDPQALTLLVECLSDESGYLRELAEAALLKLGDRGGPALLPLLRQGLWYSRASAARLLGRMTYAPGAAALVQLSADRVESVALEAEAALLTLAAHGAAVRVAWELNRVPAAARAACVQRLRARDAALGERVERLLQSKDLMEHPDPDGLRDDAPRVRKAVEGAWGEGVRGEGARPEGVKSEAAKPEGAKAEAAKAESVKGAGAKAESAAEARAAKREPDASRPATAPRAAGADASSH